VDFAYCFFLGLTFECADVHGPTKYGPYKSKKNHFELFSFFSTYYLMNLALDSGGAAF